jgi:hypothetical protein
MGDEKILHEVQIQTVPDHMKISVGRKIDLQRFIDHNGRASAYVFTSKRKGLLACFAPAK